MQILRFYAVLCLGLIIDVTIALFLFKIVFFKFSFALCLGFLSGTLSNYLLTRFWVFRSFEQKLINSFYIYALVAILILFIRILSSHILLLSDFFIDRYLLVLIISVGLSSIINFILSKYVLFNSQVG